MATLDLASATHEVRRTLQLSQPSSDPTLYGESRDTTTIQEATKGALTLVLSEPGGGKTVAMRQFARDLEASFADVHLFDLKQLSEADVQELVGNRLGDMPATESVLLLDSVDESQATFSTLVPKLARLIRQGLRNKWRVVIACRTAEVSSELIQLMEESAGRERPNVLYLRPLDEADVLEYCRVSGVPGREFVRAVKNVEAEGLATSPMLLRLLVELFLADEHLAGDRSGIYDRAISALVLGELGGQGHLRAPTRSATSLAARRAAAEHLAFLTLFGGFDEIATRLTDTIQHWTNLLPTSNSAALVDETAMREVLGSGLFVSVGPGRRAFAHRTLMEYLAARFLVSVEISSLNRARIFTIPGYPTTIPTRLFGTLVWVLRMTRDFDALAEAEPLGLILSGIQSTRVDLRLPIVRGLLRKSMEVQANRPFGAIFAPLDDPSVRVELRNALASPGPERYIALRVINDSNIYGFDAEGLSIAGDTKAPGGERNLAVEVVATTGSEGSVASLTELVTRGQLDDDQETLATALDHLWPGNIALDQVLARLEAPDEGLFGMYRVFLDHFTERASVDDLIAIIDWAATELADEDLRALRRRRRPRGRDWLGTTLTNALKRLPRERTGSLTQALGAAVWASQDDPDYEGIGIRDLAPELRSSLITQITVFAFGKGIGAHELLALQDGVEPILSAADVETLIGVGRQQPDMRRQFVRLIQYLVDLEQPAHLELYWLYRHDKDFAEAFVAFQPIKIKSPAAREARAQAHRRRKWSYPRSPKKKSEFDLVPRIRESFGRTAKDPSQFWHVFFYLGIAARDEEDLAPVDFSTTEAFQTLSTLDRTRVLKLAETVVLEPQRFALPAVASLRTHYRALYAAAQCLFFASRHKRDALDRLGEREWSLLAPALLHLPRYANTDFPTLQERAELLGLAHRRAPAAVRTAAGHLIDLVVSEQFAFAELSSLLALGDPLISEDLRRILSEGPKQLREEVVRSLLEAGDESADEWIARVLMGADPEDISTVLNVALDLTPARGTSLLLEVLRRGDEVASSSILEVASRERFSNRIRATPEDLLEAHERLVDLFAPSADPPMGPGVYAVTPRHDVVDLREEFLNLVASLGTPHSNSLLRALAERRPDLSLAYAIARSDTALKRNGWQGTPIADLQILAHAGRGPVLVRDADELLSTIAEELRKIEGTLQGLLPQAQFLWDIVGDTCRPKTEPDISDWYAFNLQALTRNRFAINREVQVSKAPRSGMGDRVDIQVDLVDPGGGVSATVMIEVKGSWNRDVLSDIQQQLVGQYLRPNGPTHGLYLVLWPPPEQRSGPPPAPAEEAGIDGLREVLEAQCEVVPAPYRVAVQVHDIGTRI